jgi:hypothetical protein
MLMLRQAKIEGLALGTATTPGGEKATDAITVLPVILRDFTVMLLSAELWTDSTVGMANWSRRSFIT